MSSTPDAPDESPVTAAAPDGPDVTAGTPGTPGTPGTAAARWDRQRAATAIVYLATPLMLLGLVDPLEGGILIALLGIPVAIAAFVLRSRARWLIVAGLALIALTFAFMTAVSQQVGVLQNLTLWPWLAAVLVIVLGDVLLLREIVARRNRRAANILTAVLLVLMVLLMARVASLLGDYQPWQAEMSERASVTGPDVRLVLHLQDYPCRTDEAYWGAAVLENTGTGPVTLPPATILDIVVRDAAGTVVWDSAGRYYGPVPKSMPWSKDLVVAPGESARRPWVMEWPGPGIYQVTAEVQGGPYDGLATQPVQVTCSAPEGGP